jgi:nucleotide-binding universal stress UspA family protein
VTTAVLGTAGSDSRAVAEVAAKEAAFRAGSLHMYVHHPDTVRRTCLTWPGLAVTARPIPRDVTGVLIEESRAAGLVVLPRDRAGRYENVVAHARCPTLIVTAHPATAADGPVAVGVDIAANDEPAIEFAFEEASLRGVPLVAVHVWSGVPRADLTPIDPYGYEMPDAAGIVDRLLAEALAGWTGKYPDVRVERRLHHNPDAVRGLIKATEGAGLVVLGANHNPHSYHLLGTVARRVLQQIDRPVAVVKLATH